MAQFMIGYVFATLGYPFCVALNASIYSKVLGDIPQVKIFALDSLLRDLSMQ